MLNNKGYVFTPLIMILIILTGLIIFNLREQITELTNEGVIVQELVDKYYFNHLKEQLSLINDKKQLLYKNASNGIIRSELLIIPEKHYSSLNANLTFNQTIINVSINYPLNELTLRTEQALSNIQNCLYSNHCSVNKDKGIEILTQCFDEEQLLTYESIMWVPQGLLVTNIKTVIGGITIIYPYNAGNHLFNC